MKELESIVFQLIMNLHGDYSRGVTLRMNDRVNLVPYLPRNGSCIQILIGLEVALLSWEQSVVG